MRAGGALGLGFDHDDEQFGLAGEFTVDGCAAAGLASTSAETAEGDLEIEGVSRQDLAAKLCFVNATEEGKHPGEIGL